MPLMPLPDAFQFRMPWESAEGDNVTVHDRQPLLKISGLDFNLDGAQLHGIARGSFAPRNVKVALARQAVLGTKMVTCIE